MVILTIGLVSLAELLAISLRMQQLGRNETAAIRLAQDKLDQLSVLNFDPALTIQPGGSLTEDAGQSFRHACRRRRKPAAIYPPLVYRERDLMAPTTECGKSPSA